MKFSDLPLSSASVLRLLADGHPMDRTGIISALKAADGGPESTTDSAIRRLVGQNLIARWGMDYKITDLGLAILTENNAVAADRPHETKIKRVADDSVAPCVSSEFAEQALRETELNQALDLAVARLQSPTIPACATRVYLRLVNSLDARLRDALAPITQIVEAQP